ncbi:AlbA family DNA-binding domain-containing protein [Arsenicibacter rosenii]|uniref:ATP-binding protein n=1 Tax=Arsenicibacter rosenii TaxID=1750698 RepID=A0A1S2VRE7_9BACT|nr:ATP-binding protein [Arsenicibacter rosenii]OIN60766.1 ATP-binding protein [Arsenicibacter rosenii]
MPYNLAELINQGEGTRLEFKSTVSSAPRIAKTLVAFANTSGGLLIVGVDDDGGVSGIESEYHEMQKIEKATDFFTEPPLSISYEVITFEGKEVLLVNVPESEEKPVKAIDERGHKILYVRSKDKSIPTNKLILSENAVDTKLLQTPNVRMLLQYFRKNDTITAAKMAQLINVSDQRAEKMLREYTEKGLLLMIDRPRPPRYSLKVSD